MVYITYCNFAIDAIKWFSDTEDRSSIMTTIHRKSMKVNDSL